MPTAIRSMRRNLLARRFLVPLTLSIWLLVSLTFLLLIPRADAYVAETGCPTSNTEAMDGVRDPSRLRVIDLCRSASGNVTYREKWSDGDENIYVQTDPSLVPGDSVTKLQLWDQAKRDGGANMLWEVIPRDQGECGIYPNTSDLGPMPNPGDTINVRGVYVFDKNWGYYEFHPLVQIGQCTRSYPDDDASSSSSSKGPSWKQGNCTWGWGGKKPSCF